MMTFKMGLVSVAVTVYVQAVWMNLLSSFCTWQMMPKI